MKLAGIKQGRVMEISDEETERAYIKVRFNKFILL